MRPTNVDVASDVAIEANDGRRSAERFLRKLRKATEPRRSLADRVLDAIDRRSPDDHQPKLRAFCDEIELKLMRQDQVRSGR